MASTKQLLKSFVLGKGRSDRIETVRELNAWGQELNDISIVRQMHALEVLSLACNQLETLKDFTECHKLRQLFLRKNKIRDVSELVYLAHLQHLSVLSLVDNPCSQGAEYRPRVLSILPQLEKLDEQEVSREEVHSAKALFPDLPPLPAPTAPPMRGLSPIASNPGSRTPPLQPSPAGSYQGAPYATSPVGPYSQAASPVNFYQRSSSLEALDQQQHNTSLSPRQGGERDRATYQPPMSPSQQLLPAWEHSSSPAGAAATGLQYQQQRVQPPGRSFQESPTPQQASPLYRSPPPQMQSRSQLTPSPQQYAQSYGSAYEAGASPLVGAESLPLGSPLESPVQQPGIRMIATPPPSMPGAASPSAGGLALGLAPPPEMPASQEDQVLYAVMSLLPLLGPQHLRIVSDETNDRLNSLGAL